MKNKDPQAIQKAYPVIDFSKVSYSKGESYYSAPISEI
jgi:hypothetical protein